MYGLELKKALVHTEYYVAPKGSNVMVTTLGYTLELSPAHALTIL